MIRQRIHKYYAFFIFLVFSVLLFLARPEPAFASPGFSVSAVQSNISKGTMKISKGDKVNLVVSSGGRNVNAASVKFKSSRKKVASVSRSGVIKAKKKGSTVITVSYGGASCKIKVKVKTSNITIYNASTGFNLSLNKAKMQPSKFRLGVKYKNKKKYVSLSKVKFSSSNSSVATVDRNGVVTLKASGVVTIKAKYKKKTGKCTIYVSTAKTAGHNQAASSSGGRDGNSSSGSSGSAGTTPPGTGGGTVSPGGNSSGGNTGGNSGSGNTGGAGSGSTPGGSSSGGSTSSGGSEPEVTYTKETEQKYSYRLEFVNRTALCTGYECILHVITDNPNTYDSSSGKGTAKLLCFVDGEKKGGGEPAFDDIKYIGSNKVADGYIFSFTFDTPGYHTISIKERYYQFQTGSWSQFAYDYTVDTNAKITFNVLDADASEEKFYSRMLQQYRGADDRSTLRNLEEYFRANFKYQSYFVNGSGSITRKLNLLANYGPWWMTFKDITCYDSTEIMINLAERLGYVGKPWDTGMKDHRVAFVYFDPSKVNVPGFDETYMAWYDACPIGTNNNYTAETFTYLY